MDILPALQFVKGAVSGKDFTPALTHFHISESRIQAFNGHLALSSPINLDINATPKAIPFFKAIQNCTKTTAIHLTPAGRLGIKSGKFKAFIPCTNEVFPEMQPSGEKIKLENGFIDALKTLVPFIAEDASRPWSRGVLFKKQSAYATNNIILIEYWLGYDFPLEVNIPHAAVKELIRIGKEPEYLMVDDKSVSFIYNDDRWLRTNLLESKWPDFTEYLNQPSEQISIPKDFFEDIDSISPFVDDLGRIFFNNSNATTSLCEGEGASVDLDMELNTSCFHVKQLLLLNNTAATVDFNQYPKPCPFSGKNLRGVIVGIKI